MGKKGVRAPYIVANFINKRPDYETCEEFSHRIGLDYVLDTKRVMKRKDVGVGLLYRVAKAFGYKVIVYNPKPPKGMESMYLVGENKGEILPREFKGIHRLSRDGYTGKLYRVPKKYKKKMVRVKHNGEEG